MRSDAEGIYYVARKEFKYYHVYVTTVNYVNALHLSNVGLSKHSQGTEKINLALYDLEGP